MHDNQMSRLPLSEDENKDEKEFLKAIIPRRPPVGGKSTRYQHQLMYSIYPKRKFYDYGESYGRNDYIRKMLDVYLTKASIDMSDDYKEATVQWFYSFEDLAEDELINDGKSRFTPGAGDSKLITHEG